MIVARGRQVRAGIRNLRNVGHIYQIDSSMHLAEHSRAAGCMVVVAALLTCLATALLPRCIDFPTKLGKVRSPLSKHLMPWPTGLRDSGGRSVSLIRQEELR
jgi:hypothetical protein